MGKAVVRFGPILGILLGLAGPVQAANDQQIKAAIRAAIAFLKSQNTEYPSQGPAGTSGNYEEGPIALTGIALLEAGVDPSDAVIQSIAKSVREQAVKQDKTYQLALDIIFLDKLGEQIDTTLIQSMGARLLGGQSALGAWSYPSGSPDQKEQTRLRTALQGAQLKGKPGEAVGLDPSSRPPLDPAVAGILGNRQALAAAAHEQGDDLSNTQFAILGLWAARRHGVPVDAALTRLDKRLRAIQSSTGGWGYNLSTTPNPTGTMTCAALIGLAITNGGKAERSMKAAMLNPDGTLKVQPASEAKRMTNPLQTDPAVQAGFRYLALVVNGKAEPGEGSGPMLTVVGAPGAPTGPDLRDNKYLLWSLERVCVVYSVPQLGGKDWHAWGSDELVRKQQANGSWLAGPHGAQVDACFALMFLCRSNIVRDLSNMMNRKMSSAKDSGLKPSTDVKPATGPAVPLDTTDPASMAKALATATGVRYAELLKQYTESKGATFTDALAMAVPQLSGDSQKRVREALAERISSFPVATIKKRLHDPNPELRRAAALAVYMSEEAGAMDLVPELFDALNDTEDLVVRGAHLALRYISKFKKDEQDFGPAPGAAAAQRAKAIADWKAWWEKKK